MIHLTTLWQVIGWLGLPLLALLAGVLVRRKAHQEFPYFFYYIVAGAFVGLARLITFYGIYKRYFYTYWITDAIATVFAFLATYELCFKRFFPQAFRVRFYRYLFPAVILAAIMFAVPALLYSHKLKLVVTTIHTFNFVRVALLFFFVALMLFMGRHWSKYEFGIALGLGIEGAALLPTFAAWARLVNHNILVNQLPVIGYDIACIVWLAYFLTAAPPGPPGAGPVSPEVIQDARRTEQQLKEWLAGEKRSR